MTTLCFYKKDKDLISVVAVYIDDILMTRNNPSELNDLKQFLDNEFKVIDLGEVHYFLGMEVIREKQGIILCQKKFTLDLLHEFDTQDLATVNSPLDPNRRLKSDEGDLLLEPTLYRRLLGKLNFLTHT